MTKPHKSEYPLHLWRSDSPEDKAPEIMQWHAVYTSYLEKSRRVLDVGCGNGFFLELIRAAEKEGYGIDIDASVLQTCRVRGLEVREVSAVDIEEIPEEIDAIHASHLLEYLTQDEAESFFNGCRKKLGSGGILLIRTSNWDEPIVRDEMFWKDSNHRRPYPLALLEELLGNAGFEITAKGFENQLPRDLFVLATVPAVAKTNNSWPGEAPVANPQRKSGDSIDIAWEGSQFVRHSLARVNREMVLSLLSSGKIEVDVIPYEAHTFGPEEDSRFTALDQRMHGSTISSPAVHVRHQWPPHFNPPSSGKWVVIQPWEYGSIPKEWVEPMKNRVDEIWVPSEWVRQGYVQSGIPSEKVFVVPNGVNLDQFHPDAPPYPLAGTEFRFLFVGGTIWRKGIDVLLDSYTSAFSNNDEVCLVIKDMGQDSIYKNQGFGDKIRALASDPANPKIVYIENELTEAELAGLYTSCHCLVHPFRGEGYGLPIAEAAASGLPVIVTRGGPCDDYLNDANALWIRAKERPCRIGIDLAGPATVLEPDRDDLVEKLHEAIQNRGAIMGRLNASLDATRETLSWEHAANIASRRLAALAGKNLASWNRQPISSSPSNTSNANTNPQIESNRSTDGGPTRPTSLEEIVAETQERASELKTKLNEMRESEWVKRGLNENDPAVQSTIAEAHRVLAKRYYEVGKYSEAKVEITEALTIQPHHAPDLLILGNISFMDGDEGQAETCFKKAVDLDPRNASGYYNLGMIYRCRSKITEAAACFEKAIQVSEDDAELYNNYGVLKFELGEIKTAEVQLKKALSLDPRHVDSAVNLSIVYRHQGKKHLALDVLEKSQRLNPDDESLMKELDEIRNGNGVATADGI